MLSKLLLALALCVGAALPLDSAEGLDYDLSRAYSLLDKGQANRAKVLFRDYLRRHPRDAWARQGYEQAGGDLAALGLRALAHADAADAAAAKAQPAVEEDNTPVKEEAKEAPTADEAQAEAAVAPEGEAPVKDGPVEEGPSWGQRMKARLLGWALLGKIFLLIVLVVALLVAFTVFGARFARWHAAKRLARVQELLGRSGANVYLDERRWVTWWGLGIDNETYNNDLIRQANLAGWRCREVQVAFPFALLRLSFPQLLLVAMIQSMTLGFMRFHVGASLLFERAAPESAA